MITSEGVLWKVNSALKPPPSLSIYMPAHKPSCAAPWGVQNVKSLKYYQRLAFIVISVVWLETPCA